MARPERCLKVLVLLSLLCVSIRLEVAAEPYIALREGLKCSSCHVNHTGGGMRNGYGALFTQTEITPLLEEMSEAALDFSADLGPSITIGSDFILSNETTSGSGDTDRQNTFAVESGNLYVNARLLPGRMSLYLDEIVAPGGAASREAFLLLEGLPLSGYAKAGRMLLPYGIRMWDDDAFVRRVTGFNFDNQDLGVEVGIEPGPIAASIAVSNGTQGGRDDDAGKQVSSVLTWWQGPFVLGGSFAYNNPSGGDRLVYGPFASASLGPLTWIGEVDWIAESAGGVDNDQFVAFTSLDLWLRQSINLRAAFDFHDPYDDLSEDERSRVSIGVDAFLTPFLTGSVVYRLRDSIPQDPTGNADGFGLSLHTHF
ncbi:MAG TPA: hypothetical protein DIC52_07580 [Candidatus Latescibacteria bacterium]|nr:hypothetical protein [Candidatus Latescibacterota bacterium]